MQIEDYFTNAKKQYEINGFFHFKSLLNIFFLKKILEKSLRFKDAKKIKTSKYLQIHNNIPEVKLLFNNHFLKSLLKNTLSFDNIYGLQSEIFYNPPKTNGYGQHQDDFFLKTGKGNSANLWIPLVNTSKKNGTVYFSSKSHKLKIKEKVNLANLNDVAYKSTLLKKYRKEHCECKIGDAILISNHIFHGSSPNNSYNNRYVLALGYINNRKNYNKGRTAKRKPFII